VHRRSIEANGDGDRWTLLEACAATEDGTVPFAADAFTASHVESLAKGHGLVAALDVFPFLDDVDLLKIDIEGSEWAILSDVRFTSDVAKAIALEYHPHGCPAEDAQEHALALLRQAGYETAVSSFPLPPGHGVLWGWRSA
jgi:methyltransferase FkbM-like protein